MDVKELRVDNLVYGPNKQAVCKVKYIDGEEKTISTDLFSERDVNEFYPIPLTEEWLLKFGFDKIENPEVIFWQKGYLRVYIDLFFDKTFNCCKREPSNPQADNFICSVKSVHQLQNLYFALTGEELHKK